MCVWERERERERRKRERNENNLSIVQINNVTRLLNNGENQLLDRIVFPLWGETGGHLILFYLYRAEGRMEEEWKEWSEGDWRGRSGREGKGREEGERKNQQRGTSREERGEDRKEGFVFR